VLRVHPAADQFEMMPEEDRPAFGEDIEKNGLREKIKLISRRRGGGEYKMVVDGRNRLDEMHRRGFEIITNGHPNPKYFETLDLKCEAEVFAYIMSANLHRRHLTADDKRRLIADLIRLTPKKSDRQIAAQIKSNRTTVGQIRKKLEREGTCQSVDTRTDTQGREQPAHKPAMAALGRRIKQDAKALEEAARARDLAATNKSEPIERHEDADPPAAQPVASDQRHEDAGRL
jgi:hypothetical protein